MSPEAIGLVLHLFAGLMEKNNMFVSEDMIDHRSYTHNLSSCEIKA